MTIDDKFNQADYAQRQAEHINARYEKYLADTGKHVTRNHYIEHIYIKLGHAQRFHDEYMRSKDAN